MENQACHGEDPALGGQIKESVREAATLTPRKPNVTRSLKEDVSESQMPREKMLLVGARSMTDAELLAIVLGSGFHNHNVLSVAQALLRDHDGFSLLLRVPINELKEYDGIGEVKALQITAVLEIARRMVSPQGDGREHSMLNHPEAVVARVLGYKIGEDTESFFVMPLDKKCRICGPMTEVTRGTLDASLVHPREVFKVALRWSAASILVAHNHPSGDPAPSKEDIDVTRKLVEAGRTLSIPLTDHIIVGDAALFPPGFHSIRRSGVVAFD